MICTQQQRRRHVMRVGFLLLAFGPLLFMLCPTGQLTADEPQTDLYGDPLPMGAVARLGTIRFRQGGSSLAAVTFLPDNMTVLTTGEESSIKFWEAESGKLLREIRVDPMSIQGFAVSRDGKQLAAGGFWHPEDRSKGAQGEMRVLDTSSGAVLRTFPRESRDMNRCGLAFSPEGKLLFSLGTSGVLRVEEISSGEELLQHAFPRDNAPSLALSPDGKSLAIVPGPNVRKFYLWHWQSGEEPQELKTAASDNGGGQSAFSPDGRHVAWGGTHDDPPHVWEVATRKLVARLPLPAHDEGLLGLVQFSPDGKQLLVPAGRNEQGGIHAWNTATWKYDRKLGIATYRFSISSDSRLLATGRRVYNFQTGQEIGVRDAAHQQRISRIIATPDGRAITASDDGSIRVWSLATGRQERKLLHDRWVRDIAVSPDGRQLVSSSLDDTVRLWNLSDGKEVYRLPGHGRQGGRRAVAFMAGGESFASFGDDFYLYLWDVRTGKAIAEHKIQPTGVKLPGEDGERDPFSGFLQLEGARFSSGGRYLVLGINRKLFVFDVASGTELRTLEHEGGSLTSLEISPDEGHLLATTWGKSIEVKLPDGRTMITTEKEGLVTMWELETGKQLQTLKVGEGPFAAAFSADKKQFAVATYRPKHRVAIYNLEGKRLNVVEDVPNRIWSLALSPDGKLIAGLDDTSALVFDLKTLNND